MLVSWSPSRWKGANSCSSVPRRDAGPLVDDGDQHAVADPARVDPHRAVGRVAQGVVDQIGQHPLQQAAVGHHHRVATSTLTRSRPSAAKTGDSLADSEQGTLHCLLEIHPAQFGPHDSRGQPRRVEQVADQRGELVDRLLDGGQQFGGVLGGEVDVVAAQARHCGLGGGQWRAQVVADGRQQRARAARRPARWPRPCRPLRSSSRCLTRPAACLATAPEHPAVARGQLPCRPSASRTRRRRPRSAVSAVSTSTQGSSPTHATISPSDRRRSSAAG